MMQRWEDDFFKKKIIYSFVSQRLLQDYSSYHAGQALGEQSKLSRANE